MNASVTEWQEYRVEEAAAHSVDATLVNRRFLTVMHWHYGGPPIWMPNKMMTSLYSLDKKASTLKCRYQGFYL